MDTLAFCTCVYQASQNYAAEMAWNGSVVNNIAGTTSAAFKDDVSRRVNMYRALVGVPAAVTFDDSNSAKDQLAALMFSGTGTITHMPTNTFTDYSIDGAAAAAHSNIAIGENPDGTPLCGPPVVDAYMIDFGSANAEVGHRRWLLYSRALVMGTGDVPASGSFLPANALWNDTNTTNPVTPSFVKWPNAGYCPLPLMPARWSVGYRDADFTNATVTMTQGSTPVAVNIIHADSNALNGMSFLGENSLVWEPANLPASIAGDTTFTVTVSGIANAGGTTSITYNVTLFDPNVLGQSSVITGTATPPSSGATYNFTGIDQADAYDFQVAQASTAAWTEGAESSPTPQIATATTGTYSAIQSAVKRTGSRAFQLAFPQDVDSNNALLPYDFFDQNFEITRPIIPSASSNLQFYDLCRFAITATTLSAQVSTDNGLTWTQVWSRAGTVPSGGTSAQWDTSFIANNVSLSAYAGHVILVRFVLSNNGQSAFLGTTANDGFFIDDVTVTNATQLVNLADTTLPGSATTFALNSASAGGTLQAGVTYYMRVRPQVGLRWFGFGDFFTVTPTSTNVTSYSNWTTFYPAVIEGVTGDHSGDGIPNGLKYAFGLDPTVHNGFNAVPGVQISANALTLTYAGSAAGVTYGAETSTDLTNWNPVADSGASGNHIFTVLATGPHTFLRHKIIVTP